MPLASRTRRPASRDLRDDTGAATADAVRIVWTSDYIESARLPQPSLVAAIESFPRH
jgi:hypothetical protein